MIEQKRRRKIRFEALLLAAIVPVTLILLVIHSASSLTIEAWWIETEYEEGDRFKPSNFTTTIVIGVGNKGVFPVTTRNARVKLIINGIRVGTLDVEEDWYNISAFGWRRFEATLSIIGDDADSIELADSYDVYLVLTGEVSCVFYTTRFETASRRIWPK